MVSALEEQGFEPRSVDAGIALANCPFHALASRHTELVCGMNLHLLEGLLEGVPSARLTARLRPEQGMCCVLLEAADPA